MASSSLSTLYPSISAQTLSQLPILSSWTATKDWCKTSQNQHTYMDALDNGFGMYVSQTQELVAVLGVQAVEEVRPIVEDAEREVGGKEWDEGRQCWV